MNLRRWTLVFCAFASSVVACSSEPSASPGSPRGEKRTSDGDAGGGTSSEHDAAPLPARAGGLSIRVEQARLTSSNSLQIAVTVSVGEGAPAVLLNPEYFSLKTDDGLLHTKPTYSATRWWIDGTSPAATSKLLPGQTLQSWRLTFDDVRYGGASPVQLYLKVPSGDVASPRLTASASITLEACRSCSDGTCTYLDRDDGNCGICGMKAGWATDTAPAPVCVGGAFQCAANLRACPSRTDRMRSWCVDLQTSADHCGACDNSLTPGAQCMNGEVGCSDSRQVLCAGSCTNLLASRVHCGACGVSIPYDATCENGVPRCQSQSHTVCGNACVSLATNGAHCGACGNVCDAAARCKNAVCITEKQTASPAWRDGNPATCDELCAASGLLCFGPSPGVGDDLVPGHPTIAMQVPCASRFNTISQSIAGNAYYLQSATCQCKQP